MWQLRQAVDGFVTAYRMWHPQFNWAYAGNFLMWQWWKKSTNFCALVMACDYPHQLLNTFWNHHHFNVMQINTLSLTLYVPCIILQCVDKPTKCTDSNEWSLFLIIWLYMFRTVTSLSSGASSHKPYNALVRSCYQAGLAVAWMYIHTAARLACANGPMRYTHCRRV